MQHGQGGYQSQTKVRIFRLAGRKRRRRVQISYRGKLKGGAQFEIRENNARPDPEARL